MFPTAPRGLGRRVLLSFVAGVFLLASLVGPAGAIIWVAPAVGSVITGAAIRAAAGQAARTVPLALGTGAGRAASWAAQSQAANTIGVMAVGTVAFCGTGSVLDVCSNPKFKVRPDGAPEPQEEVSASIPATVLTTAPINVQEGSPGIRWKVGVTFGGPWDTSLYATQNAACDSPQSHAWAVQYNGAGTWVFQTFGGSYCHWLKNGSFAQANTVQGVSNQCSTGFTNVGGTCTKQDCPADYTMNGGTCEKKTCPAGFTLSGSTCNPVAGTWVPDGSPTFENIGGTWTPHPKDPDIPDASVTPPNPWNWSGMDEYGNPTQIQLTATPTGGVQIQTWQQGTGGGGNSTVTHNTINIGPTGIWNSATTNVYNGDLSTVGNSGSTTPTPSQPLPTDYQKDATGQTTNTKLQTIIDGGVKVKEDGVPTTGDFTAAQTAINDAATARETGLGTVTSASGKSTSWAWSMALPTGCSSLSVDMRVGSVGRILEINPCAYQSVIHDLMSMVWAATALFLAFGMVGRTLREA